MGLSYLFIRIVATILFGIPAFLRLIYWSLFKEGWEFVFNGKNNRTIPPKCLQEWGTHKYLNLPNSIKIHYVENKSENKNQRPLMLFLHGFPDFWFCWRYQLNYFSDKYYCVAIDNRGYGYSDKPVGIDEYTMDKLTGDVRDVIRELGYEKCILVGHDWGGAIGYAFTSWYPEMVSTYIACNMPHPMSFRKVIDSSWKQKLMSWYILFFQAPMIPELFLGSKDNKMLETIAEEAHDDNQENLNAYKYIFAQKDAYYGPVNYYRASLKNPSERSLVVKDVPVYSVYGDADKYLSLETILGSGEFVDNFSHTELKGISHWVQTEAKDELNQLIEKHLKKLNF